MSQINTTSRPAFEQSQRVKELTTFRRGEMKRILQFSEIARKDLLAHTENCPLTDSDFSPWANEYGRLFLRVAAYQAAIGQMKKTLGERGLKELCAEAKVPYPKP